jgi:hypothetical protein
MNSHITEPQKSVTALSAAVQLLQAKPPALLDAVDQILVAGLYSDTIELSLMGDSKILIRKENNVEETVELPQARPALRAILARVGTICSSTSKRSAPYSRLRSLLVRLGVVHDKLLVENRSNKVRYLSSEIKEQPGSPLYSLDAELCLSDIDGRRAALHVRTQNTGSCISLTIRSRK